MLALMNHPFFKRIHIRDCAIAHFTYEEPFVALFVRGARLWT